MKRAVHQLEKSTVSMSWGEKHSVLVFGSPAHSQDGLGASHIFQLVPLASYFWMSVIITELEYF